MNINFINIAYMWVSVRCAGRVVMMDIPCCGLPGVARNVVASNARVVPWTVLAAGPAKSRIYYG